MYSLLKSIITRQYFVRALIKSNAGFKYGRTFANNVEEIKFNFNKECESQINLQINEELYASYAYLSVAYHFQHPAVALPGFFSMFLFFSREEAEHARKLMEFQNKRGGKVQYSKIEALQGCDWTPESAVEKAIDLEKCVTKNLLVLHEKGSQHKDWHLCDFVEAELLQEQYKAIRDLYHLLARIKRVQQGVGIYILDKDLNKEFEDKQI